MDGDNVEEEPCCSLAAALTLACCERDRGMPPAMVFDLTSLESADGRPATVVDDPLRAFGRL